MGERRTLETDRQSVVDLFSRTSDAVIAIDSVSTIVAWNAGATELLGRRPEETLGKCCADVLGWRDRDGNLVCGPRCAIKTRAERELASQTEDVLATNSSGELLWVNVSSHVLPREYHDVCQIVHCLHEVTFTSLEEAVVRVTPADQARRQLLQTLTAREHEVLEVLAIGATNAEIANRLSISRTTAQNHVAHILSKLGVHSRLEAIVWLCATERPTPKLVPSPRLGRQKREWSTTMPPPRASTR